MNANSIQYRVAFTPNPNSKKFIFETLIKTEGKSFYEDAAECKGNPLANGLFTVPGIQKLGIFGNVITVSKSSETDWDELEMELAKYFEVNLPMHDPMYIDSNPVEERRSALPPLVQKIEEILDRTIRPYIQQDGGDVECLAFEDNILTINYKGACGSCPSSMAGTLASITQTLRTELDLPELEVVVGNSAEPPHYSGKLNGGGYPGMWDDVEDYEEDEDLTKVEETQVESKKMPEPISSTHNLEAESGVENLDKAEIERKKSIKERINRISKIFK